MKEHEHVAKNEPKVYCWTGCVMPGECKNPAAHGGVEYVEECACGARRSIEATAGIKNASDWVILKYRTCPTCDGTGTI